MEYDKEIQETSYRISLDAYVHRVKIEVELNNGIILLHETIKPKVNII